MRLVSWVALVLWLVTVAVGGWYFVRGQTHAASDGRQAIELTEQERTIVLKEMRAMLGSVQGITQALADEDLEAVAEAARKSGIAMQDDVPGSLMMKLPLDFKRMGMDAHTAFDGIAAAARQGETRTMLLDRLSNNLQRCVACHDLYRLP